MERRAHLVELASGESVLATPLRRNMPGTLPGGLRLAVVLDRSRSMEAHREDVVRTLDRFLDLAEGGAQVDLYLAASDYSGETPSRAHLADARMQEIRFAGGQNAADLLLQYEALRGNERHDAIFILTDGAGYQLGPGDVALQAPDAPVWMVHLSNDFSLGYDDDTLEAIQASGGGAAGTVDEAVERFLAARTGNADPVDGYRWEVIPEGSTPSANAIVRHDGSHPFAALAARCVILATMRDYRGALSGLDRLDDLHAIAVEREIVTPYSSMIVLVTDEQQRMLDRLERGDDRFEREYEEVGETVPETLPTVTGVPEPEEWVLLLSGAVLLLWYLRRQWVFRAMPRFPGACGE